MGTGSKADVMTHLTVVGGGTFLGQKELEEIGREAGKERSRGNVGPSPSHHGLPRWLSGNEAAWQCRRCRFNPWVRKIPWSRKWQPTLVFLPGRFHGQRRLVGYSPWGHKESDTTEHTHTLVAKHGL